MILFGLGLNFTYSQEIEIKSKIIKIEENGNKIIGEKDVFIETKDGIQIYSDYAFYKKDKDYIRATGNVIIKDVKKDVIINTKTAEYSDKDKILKTVGFTTTEIQKKYFIKSQNINYNILKKNFTSKNKTEIDFFDKNFLKIKNIIYQINKNLISGEKLEYYDLDQNKYFVEKGIYDLKKGSLLGKDVKGYFNKETFGNSENDPRVAGLKIFSNKKKTKIHKGIFTTCKIKDDCPPWSLKAEEVKHDKIKKTIYYKNSWLSVYDVPVLYFPKFFHPDPTVKRQSGFLAPRLSSSNTFGSSIYLPYFYALDLDKDITIKPKIYEGKKFILQNEYRQVTKNASNIFDFSFGKSDINQKNDNKETKSHFFANSSIDLELDEFINSTLNVNVQRSSDESYLKAYNIESPLIDYNSTLDNTIEFNADTENSNLTIKSSVYEDKSISRGSDKYEYVFPSFSFINYNNINLFGGSNLTFTSNGSYRQYDTNSEEGKLVNNLLINKKLFSNYGLRNEFSSVIKNVNIQNDLDSEGQEKIRFLTETMFKSSLPLEKEKNNLKSILIPTIALRFSPNKTDNMINEDKIIDIDNIFSLNRLGKNEIVEEGQSLTIGNEFKILNKEDRELLSFDLAANFRDNYAEDLPIKSTINKKSSDLFGKAKINFSDSFNLNHKFSLDNDYKTINYNFIESEIKFDNFVTSFEFLEESDAKGAASYISNESQYKFDENNSILFRTRENKKKDLTEFYDLVYEYKNDCLTAGIKYKKTYYQDRDYKPKEDLLLTITLYPLTQYEQKVDDNLYN